MSEYECPEQNKTESNPGILEGVLITRGAVEAASELNIGNIESDEAVTVIGGSGLPNGEVLLVI